MLFENDPCVTWGCAAGTQVQLLTSVAPILTTVGATSLWSAIKAEFLPVNELLVMWVFS
jgi:hypothetical protein